MKKKDPMERTVPVEHYVYALQQRNLVYNHDFRYFSNRKINGSTTEYGIPDGWQYRDNGSNGTINFDSTTKQCVIQKSGGSELMEFKQALHEFPRWQQILSGETVTAGVILNTGKEGHVSVTVSDGVNSNTVTKSDKGQMIFDLQLTVALSATGLTLSITTTEPFITLNISYCYANAGLVALKHLPCIVQGVIGERKQYIATETPPAEELSLCNGLKELDNQYTRLKSVINNKFGINDATGNPYLINMGGYFSRAWDNGSGTDPDAGDRSASGNGKIKGDHVSTLEKDIFLKHNHGLDFSINKQVLTGDKVSATIIDVLSSSKTNDESEGKETRPVNIAELYTIKWA
ncbi:hypothetical protein [Sinomicrobium sp. M5D2P17]